MKNFIISLIFFIPFALLGIWWYNSCSVCKIEKTPVTLNKEKSIEIEKNNEKIDKNNFIPISKSNIDSKINSVEFINIRNDEGNIIFKFPNKLKIVKNSDSIIIAKSALKIKDSLHNYLNKNQNKELLISGWYNEKEKISESDYGLQRAKHLKATLVKFGLNSDKISTASELVNFNFQNNEFNGGVDLSFKEISEEKAEKINEGIKSKKLYTKFNSRKFIPDNTLLTYTYDLENYLKNHPNESVKIIGHTDNVGEELDNIVIARDRATNVMRHFIKNGIEKSKLEVFSKGEKEPIANNNTKEGRAKNRRIEIIVN